MRHGSFHNQVVNVLLAAWSWGLFEVKYHGLYLFSFVPLAILCEFLFLWCRLDVKIGSQIAMAVPYLFKNEMPTLVRAVLKAQVRTTKSNHTIFLSTNLHSLSLAVLFTDIFNVSLLIGHVVSQMVR
mmetsp:Transcript_25535/g.62716  ORF Transcript_25535/g.62716 Transcript_25535/m.62716 type:complete len:127 (-) Transcript_25535:951-1331(-)